MSNRIQPTHFIEVFNWDGKAENNNLLPISDYQRYVGISSICPTIALFLIRLKTPQEQENSIYYPKPTK